MSDDVARLGHRFILTEPALEEDAARKWADVERILHGQVSSIMRQIREHAATHTPDFSTWQHRLLVAPATEGPGFALVADIGVACTTIPTDPLQILADRLAAQQRSADMIAAIDAADEDD